MINNQDKTFAIVHANPFSRMKDGCEYGLFSNKQRHALLNFHNLILLFVFHFYYSSAFYKDVIEECSRD